MAASAWAVYNDFKRYMGDNTIDMDLASEFRIHLFLNTSNAGTTTLSTLGSLTNQLVSGNGYTQSGVALTQTWTTGASAGVMRFDSDDPVFSATGANFTNLQYAAIVAQTGGSGKDGTNKLVCFSQLSSAAFTINDGSTLTIQMNASGIFELT
jgi:hypothetical protein